MFTVLPLVVFLAAAPVQSATATAPQTPMNAASPSAAPNAGATPRSTTPGAAPAGQSCPAPSTNDREIIICTQRTEGYRLNPDVMEAKREMRSGGRPPRPGGAIRPDCATVGPAPCVTAGINLIAAAATAAEMAARLAKGQEIGSMFVTDPHPSEYQLYEMAKARREAREAEKAAVAKAKAGKAETATAVQDGGPQRK